MKTLDSRDPDFDFFFVAFGINSYTLAVVPVVSDFILEDSVEGARLLLAGAYAIPTCE